MRPIDADELWRNLTRLPGDYAASFAGRACLAQIEDAPTIDYAPIRHSTWDEYENTIVCKACGEKWSIREDGDFVIIEAKEDLKYCPSCGTKMDGGKEDA